MRFLTLALVLALSSATALAAEAPKPKGRQLPVLLREIEDKYTEAKTIAARFTQVNESAALQQKKTSSGIIFVKRPGKVRWETLAPDKNLLVSDGRKFWFYTPPFDEGESGQVIERKSADVKSKLAHALLSGSFSVARDLRIKQLGPSEFSLLPKRGTAGTVSEARIQVDPDKKLIEKVTLSHRDGNRSEISLSQIELGKALGDELFVFEAPPNTDRVKE
ncbi:MAG: outer membrane lipoprotein chaperone LolA [Oligoflexia bacterium]|nr:outer membrane lipoprotein chaperone LolA [Oligoflexia bacterium]